MSEGRYNYLQRICRQLVGRFLSPDEQQPVTLLQDFILDFLQRCIDAFVRDSLGKQVLLYAFGCPDPA
ncbi:hypothetical protein [Dictyobacter kobayashii]|uniref:Uncharacterized protein n=1 Tax=Dictyobacter kobayashii TaxID=2014872 RepID=A0A402ABV0_9CHLR|nr:hypothetical protein [Dictyobacter kobayashii]GCE16563.1 hypothetical protein KDK_03630 [Dictyobacter kobayashii]